MAAILERVQYEAEGLIELGSSSRLRAPLPFGSSKSGKDIALSAMLWTGKIDGHLGRAYDGYILAKSLKSLVTPTGLEPVFSP